MGGDGRRLRWLRRCDLIADLVGDVEDAFGFAGGLSDLVADELGGGAGVRRGDLEELLDGDVDFSDVAVAEGALGFELDVEDEAVGVGGGDEELHGEVPGGGFSAVLVDGRPLLRSGVVAEGGDGVDVHLAKEIHVFQVLG